MGEVIQFPETKGQLAQAIDLKIASNEVMQETEETGKSILRWILPEIYFMTPGEIVVYLEGLRQQEIALNEKIPLLEQVSEKKQASL